MMMGARVLLAVTIVGPLRKVRVRKMFQLEAKTKMRMSRKRKAKMAARRK